MKPVIFLFSLFLPLMLHAQVSKKIEAAAGTLKTALTDSELNTITNLTIEGSIDARDFKTMRDNMPLLSVIDLSGVFVEAYTGTEGTSWRTTYTENVFPEYAFWSDVTGSKTSLISVSVPSSVNTIGEGAFSGCSGLTSVTIPSSVTTIGQSAFSQCSGLVFVRVPSSVKTIKSGAFEGCSGLTAITIPSFITSIEYATFWDCAGLNSVAIPASVTSIGSHAFFRCSRLNSITLPSSVNSIGENAFDGCTGLNSIHSHISIPANLVSAPSVFTEVNKNTCKLYVPYGSSALYTKAIGWKDFSNIIEMPDIKLSATTVNIAADQASTAAIEISSNVEWAALSDQSWITISPASGNGNQTLTFKAEKNPLRSARTALVSISATGGYLQTIFVMQEALNLAPIANAGPDQTVDEGSTVTLDGSASSDPENVALTYNWTAPTGITLDSVTAIKPIFIAPEVIADTEYIFSLVVNDGNADSPADEVVVKVKKIYPKVIQNIALNIGWNIVSVNVVPDDLNLKNIFQPLIEAGKLKKVMDENDKTIEYSEPVGGWSNDIGNLTATNGYKVNVSGESTLSVEGVPVQLPLDITLNAGWNIIAYPDTNIQNAKVLIQSLIDDGKLIKVMDEAGKSIEDYGSHGGWKNAIGNFVPGKGYKVNVLENCTLTIPANVTKTAVFIPDQITSEYFKPVFIGNGTDHMNINLVNLQASGLTTGDEIGIFDGQYCVGSATVGTEDLMNGSIGIPSSGNDYLEETINGFIPGHAVTLKLYRGGQTYLLNAMKVSGTEWFEKNASLFAEVNTNDMTTVQIVDDSIWFKCYPNPFSEEITIEIHNPKRSNVKAEIYNFTGQLIKNLSIENTDKHIEIIWNATNDLGQKVPSGVYFCKIGNQSMQILYSGLKESN
ncbi:MAG: leucine-rich repeat protein [Prolixibacteraceae bacterium]|nr:leucine-rich repeat protein [Prolixibacteraceae bacterium]